MEASRLVGAHFLRGVALGRALGAGLVVLALLLVVLVLVLVGVGVALVAEFERLQQIVHDVAELAPGPRRSGSSWSSRGPILSSSTGRHRSTSFFAAVGRRQAGQPLAHQHRQRVRQRRVGAVGDLVELAAMEMIVEHRGEVLGHAGHAPRAERLDARLLDRLEHAARLRIARHQLAMQFGIVTGELQRDRIGVAAHDRGVALAHFARRLGQPRLAGRQPGPLGGERDFQLRRLRDRAQAATSPRA